MNCMVFSWCLAGSHIEASGKIQENFAEAFADQRDKNDRRKRYKSTKNSKYTFDSIRRVKLYWNFSLGDVKMCRRKQRTCLCFSVCTVCELHGPSCL